MNGEHLMLEENKREQCGSCTCQLLLSERNLLRGAPWDDFMYDSGQRFLSFITTRYSMYRQKPRTLLKTYDALLCPCWLAEMAIFKINVCFLHS